MIRKIIKIDEEKCNGCGDCVPGCAEGALQVIDGKVRLISDLFCDGLGACIGTCDRGALTIEEREAEPYDERKVMDYIIAGGENVIRAHIIHLREHNEFEYLETALEVLKERNIPIPSTNFAPKQQHHHGGGCPGSKAMSFETTGQDTPDVKRPSHLTQWPVQLHLISPQAAYYRNSDLLLAADCVGFAYPDFHKDFLKDKSIAIACPKLDSDMDSYIEKLTQLIDEASVNSITVAIMQVPCCGGLLRMAQMALHNASRNVPLKVIVVSIQGEILQEQYLN